MSTSAELEQQRDEALRVAEKIKRALQKAKDSGESQQKIDEIQNKKSAGLFKLKSNNRTIEKYDNPDFDENYLRLKVSSSPLGYCYFLPTRKLNEL